MGTCSYHEALAESVATTIGPLAEFEHWIVVLKAMGKQETSLSAGVGHAAAGIRQLTLDKSDGGDGGGGGNGGW